MLISGPGQLTVRLIEGVHLIRAPPNRGFTVFTIALRDILGNRALQMSPQKSQEEGKKPKTPEPGIDGETARENLGYDNEGALDGEDVSSHHVTYVA